MLSPSEPQTKKRRHRTAWWLSCPSTMKRTSSNPPSGTWADQVQVYVLDNWSNDGTWELVRNNASGNLIGAERFPADPSRLLTIYRAALSALVAAIVPNAPGLGLLHDADEYFQAPWPSTSLRSALFRVEQELYNAISFQWITFPPVDNSFEPGTISPSISSIGQLTIPLKIAPGFAATGTTRGCSHPGRRSRCALRPSVRLSNKIRHTALPHPVAGTWREGKFFASGATISCG